MNKLFMNKTDCTMVYCHNEIDNKSINFKTYAK